MSPGAFAFIAIALFMIHEFDEIIFIRRYIDERADDERCATEMFIAAAGNYPSTESIAAVICEEFIVATLILAIGIILGSVETIAATFIVHALHLIAHIREALVFPGWAPGSRTAVLTSPLVAATLWAAFAAFSINYPLLIVLTAVIGAALLVNLGLLHRLAGEIDESISKAVRRRRGIARSTPDAGALGGRRRGPGRMRRLLPRADSTRNEQTVDSRA